MARKVRKAIVHGSSLGTVHLVTLDCVDIGLLELDGTGKRGRLSVTGFRSCC